MKIKPLKKNSEFVAFVSDINLKEKLNKREIEILQKSIDKFGVLVFRNQSLTDDEQVNFSEYFGNIEHSGKKSNITKVNDRRLSTKLADVSNIDKKSNVFKKNDPRRIFNLGNRLWHSDSSFKKIPAKYSLLSSKTIVKKGGNTEFSDMRLAYENLEDDIRSKIETLYCEHSLIYSRQRLGFDMEKELSKSEIKNFKPVLQPMVREIRENNRKTIYLSSHIGKIKGWLRPDAMSFVDDLIEYATQKKFKYVHKWKVNDLIMWDNRQTMHRVRSFDDVNETRDMRRTTIEGEEALI